MTSTPRFHLPLLEAGQAQKEITHNEALTRIDLLLGGGVEGAAVVPATAPSDGQAWIVAAGAIGAWAGHDHELALWTAGGWRFVAVPEGSELWQRDIGVSLRRETSGWVAGEVRGSVLKIAGISVVQAQQPAIPVASGGATVDTQARAAIASILAALRTHGLIAT